MRDYPMLTFVHGKNVDDMGEDELRVAIKQLVSLLKTYEDARSFSRELKELDPRRNHFPLLSQ